MRTTLALLLVVAPTLPYIDGGGAQITLPEIILEFHTASLVEVDKIDVERGAFRLKIVRPLKGLLAAKEIKLQIGWDASGPNPFRNVKPGQPAIFFTRCFDNRSLTCIDGIWSWTQPAADGWESGSVRADFEHVFVGKSTELADAVVQLLRGREVIVRCRRHEGPGQTQFVRYSMKTAHDKFLARDPKASPAGARPLSAWVEDFQDPRASVRVQAGLALAELGPSARKAETILAAGLKDRDPEVRYAAILALEAMGSDSQGTIDALTRTLEDEAWFVRFPAIQALQKLGPRAKSAVPALIGALTPKDGVKDFRPIRCAQAAVALAKIDPGAKEVRDAIPLILEKLLGYDGDGSDGARVVGATTLGECGPAAASAVPALVKRLRDPDGDVRVAAAAALVKIAPDKHTDVALATLLAELKNPEILVRIVAADALGDLGSRAKGAAGGLQTAQQDPEPEVRQAATEALRRIAGK
jgi:HEAT repeat protein